MNKTTIGAALLTAVCAATTAAPALAGDAEATGCVSNAAYAKLSVGQTRAYVRAVAGDGAQVSTRHWRSGANAFHEHLYAMCTPRDRDHATLTTRFLFYRGAWRALLVDTRIGPED